MSDLSYMKQNVTAIKSRVLAAQERSNARFPGRNVTVVAAIKYTDADHINYLHRECGISDVGENRVQQLLERWDALDRQDLRMHFIGKLQSNKVKYIIDKVCMIHSLDSRSLAKEIEKQASKHNLIMDVLVEINSGCEESKSGLLPEEATEFCRSLSEFPHLNLRGFMTMAPKCEKKEDYRKYFQETYQLCLDIWQKTLHNIGSPIISMGMSDSFEAAVEEGATIVRIGRALFEPPKMENN